MVKIMNLLHQIMGKSVRLILLSGFLLCLTVLFCMAPPILAGPGKVKFYFYSSETNINNFKSLKMEFDGYLSKFGSYEFQPFDKRELFEQHIRNKENCLIFLSSWHYHRIYQDLSLKPALIGVRNGKSFQKRILVANEKAADMNKVKKGPIASASNTPHTQNILGEMFKGAEWAKTVRVLKVPKDVDALMSVGFGVSKFAITTESALDNLKQLDPMTYKKIKILAQGRQSLLLILAVPEGFDKQARNVVKMIKDMPGYPDGMNIIKMIELDGWKRVDPSDQSKLEG